MYLSRLILNPRSRKVWREIAEPYQMHRTIMGAFPQNLSKDERVLFRMEQHPRTGALTLLVQSQHRPGWGHLTAPHDNYLLPHHQMPDALPNPAVKSIDLSLTNGQTLSFRLLANPTVKRKLNGKSKRLGLYREEEQMDWLKRKIEAAGCRLIATRSSQQNPVGGLIHRKEKTHKIKMAAVRFEGVLRVNHPNQLLQAINNGIGSGKGLGFGLLSLGPV